MFRGSMVALVTPMLEDGSVCWTSLENLIEFHIENGTTGIVAVGTTGESATLDVAEHTEVIKFTIERVRGRVAVIAGTGANATKEAIHLTHSAKELGADGCLLVTPYYNKPGQEGLFQHYTAVADAVSIPQILYNVPGRTACDIKAETVGRLSTHKNIVGIKEATGDIDRAKAILNLVDSGFDVLSGDDASSLEFMKAGGHGVISVTANVTPKAMSSFCQACAEGNWELAERLNEQMMPLHKKLFTESNPIPVKWAMEEMGLIPPGIRLPLTRLAENHQDIVRQALIQAGVI
ncbi:4-hydroxy-tetrahydrodipicolinate synthase [Gynuella sunshinyii]|uniref:4-hydroxy-tetrahydrodipicolinate synthase n=1 Tax=Gynuella sunshinyii YC6258 TaxID=1445510 RepID=A0A0C5VK30_9GAMM|nr:4-hydroxy-tetrahydrodipicolinate synthase [Gynuella sunshinyii]AJQ94631.1 dihydrodipicolinate synthase/N-acetylneuraminate lyase [Gynuella sunshinyii YC6258]